MTKKSELIVIRDSRSKEMFQMDDAYLNGYAKLCGWQATIVYNCLCRHANFHTQEAFPAIERMAETLGVDRKTVLKGIKALVDWGVIGVQKGKDPKTRRQLPNLYILIDKSQWRPKDSRVPVEDSESRVPVEDLSRVPDKDCKVYKAENVTKGEQSNGLTVAGDAIKNSKNERELTDVIQVFEAINTKSANLYARNAERMAVARLIEQYGSAGVLRGAKAAVACLGKAYAPRITKPTALERKWPDLVAYHLSEKDKAKKSDENDRPNVFKINNPHDGKNIS